MRAALATVGLLLGACAEPAREAADYDCTLDQKLTDRPEGEQIQALLDAAVADGLPGVTVLIRQKTGEVFTASSGWADLDADAPMEPCTPMRVGGVSMMMASTALLTLAQEGQVGLDDTVASILDEGPATRIANLETITVRQLLNHTSGVPDYALSECALSQLNEQGTPLSADQILSCVAGMPAAFDPGADWGVSNTNYVLIGQILEAVTGQAPSEVLAERVTTPMGLANTTLSEDGIAPVGTARGYSDLSGQGDVYDLTDTALGYGQLDAGVVSTANDLTIFAETLLIREFLDEGWLGTMKGEVKIDGDGKDYGLGLIVKKDGEWGKAFGHQGIMMGYMGEVWYLPNARTSVALLVNGSLGSLQDRGLQLAHEELAPLLLASFEAAATTE